MSALQPCVHQSLPLPRPALLHDEFEGFPVRVDHHVEVVIALRGAAQTHVDGAFRARRGEFRLVALPGGRTRLAGSTWYELRMAPEPYRWLWSDALVHAILQRVLVHVKCLAGGGTPVVMRAGDASDASRGA